LTNSGDPFVSEGLQAIDRLMDRLLVNELRVRSAIILRPIPRQQDEKTTRKYRTGTANAVTYGGNSQLVARHLQI
jgi:hypothetical protein